MKNKYSLIAPWGILSLILLTLGSAVVSDVWVEWQRTLTQENDRLSTQSHVLQETVVQNLGAVNQVLSSLAKDKNINENRLEYSRDLKIMSKAVPGVHTLLVLDAKGQVKYANRQQLIGQYFAHRDYFKVPFENGDSDTLYVSKPFRSVTGTLTMNLTRIITGSNGEFGGVISAALNLAHFLPLLDTVRYAPGMYSGIADSNGNFLLMVPEDKEIREKQITISTTINPPTLNMNFPLSAVVSRQVNATFASWRHEALVTISLFSLLSLITIIGLRVYLRRLALHQSQEKATQQFIEEQNLRYSIASEAASIGFWDYDIAAQKLHWDEIMFKLYGLDRCNDQLPYELWSKQIHPEDRARCEKTLEEDILSTKVSSQNEFRIVWPSGEIRHIKAFGKIVRDANGQALKMFGINYDDTEIRQAKQRQERLIKQLTSINDELNKFVYVASHDLRSPLRGIDQLAAWITEDLGEELDHDTQEHLRLMRSRINRMEMLLEDLLAYSRAGRTDDEIIPVNTHDLVSEIFELVATSDKKIKLDLADNMPLLRTRKVPLELVFRNLIGNAIKHHDKALGKISISARPIANNIEFEVRDDGPGIPLEHQQRVFAMFQTLKPRDEVEGSGMGLALVKKAVESVDGAITLESGGERGSCFRFTWPTTITEEHIT